MNDSLLHILLQSAIGAILAICFFSAFLLRMHAEQIRSRKLLAGLMLTWGIIYLLALFTILAGQGDRISDSRGVASPFSLFMGNFAVIVTTFYVVEVVRPGWLTWQRVLLWFSPFLLLVSGYFIGLAITGQSISHLPDLRAMSQHLGDFNVWYRCILLLLCFGYLGAMLFVFLHYSIGYRRWVANHYSNDEKMNISWVWIYNFGLLCMTVNYLISLLDIWRYIQLSHFTIVIVFFSYINYKALFHINPYPEGYFRKTMDDDRAEREWEEAPGANNTRQEGEMPEEGDLPELPFMSRIEEYKSIFESWIQREKPYLQPDFKLTDITIVLPINRSYLSRLINEAYGISFSRLVRQYRIEEAKRLMKEHPEITQKILAKQCGFTSQQALNRAFITETGKTPKEYIG